jgi:hypothetical protein
MIERTKEDKERFERNMIRFQIPKAWQDLHDEKRAPKGHVYLARGPHVWGLGITRGDALRKARSIARPEDRKRCYAQCLPDDVKVSEIDGYAWWDNSHPKDCEHCELNR